MVEFRKRIGEAGIELILKESIRINFEEDDKNKQDKDKRGKNAEKDQTVFIDSTVQEKNITFPTDSKLLNKIINYYYKVADKEGIKLKQTYKKEVKELKKIQRWRGRSHKKKKVAAANRRMRTIAGRLVREILRKINNDSAYIGLMEICNKFVKNEKHNGHKIYSIHEPDAVCICKGKDHKKYEFGNKVSIARTYDGLIVGALGFRNEYDGQTLGPQLDQVKRLYSRQVKFAACDRGYRGVEEVDGVKILIPGTPKSTDNQYQRDKKHRLFCKRAGIEPVIGHCKSDHRLCRNFLQGSLWGQNKRNACSSIQLQCEMKFSEDEYYIDEEEDTKLRRRISSFKEIIGKKSKSVRLTFVTTYGLASSRYNGRVNDTVVLDDLFK